MAEIALKIGSVRNMSDGDIVTAWGDRRIRTCWAEMLCHPWQQKPTKHGLRPSNHCRDWYELTHQYRFERIDRNWIRRTVIATGEWEIYGTIPNAAGEYMHVDLYVRRRLAEIAPNGGPRMAMFGKPGREVWYGGKCDTSHARLDRVWKSITRFTGITEDSDQKYRLVPWGRDDIREYLCVRLDPFEDAEAEQMVLGGRVDWRSIVADLGATHQQAIDPHSPIGLTYRNPDRTCRNTSVVQPPQPLSIVKSRVTNEPLWPVEIPVESEVLSCR